MSGLGLRNVTNIDDVFLALRALNVSCSVRFAAVSESTSLEDQAALFREYAERALRTSPAHSASHRVPLWMRFRFPASQKSAPDA